MGATAEESQPEFAAAREAALKAVITEIQSAFSKVKREDGVTLHETDVIDRCGSEQEKAKVKQIDTDKTWAEVPSKNIESHNAALCFLDPKGFRYYLPAFMIWSLTNYLTSGSLSSDATIYSLDIGNKQNEQKRKMEQFGFLDKPQNRAVAHFLKFMIDFGCGYTDEFMAKQALEKYWKKFL